MRTLDVWCFGRRAGQLSDDPAGVSFSYDLSWIADKHPPLSRSLPLTGDFGIAESHAFFGGLLPEGEPRALLARRLGLSPGNDFALLEAIGGECAGAITVLPPHQDPAKLPSDVRWLDEAQVEQLVIELPQRPMYADEGGEYRLSLAGAQDKLPVVADESGRIGLPIGAMPSTHILKAPITRLPATVLNEAFCLRLGRELGLDTVSAQPRRAGATEFLLVERYDRTQIDGRTVRLHQEDFCQALGVPPERKYQREGGPGLPECFALVNRVTSVPADSAVRLLDAWALSYLAGNHDAHAKNFSLLYQPGSTSLAPIYDVLSSVVYWKVAEMDRKMAMNVGGEYRPKYVRTRHLESMLTEAGLNPRLASRRLAGLAERAPAAVASARDAVEGDGESDPLLDKVMKVVQERSRWLGEIAVGPAPAGSAAGNS